MAKLKTRTKPPVGEETKQQRGGTLGFLSDLLGFGPVRNGNFNCYREMRKSPTLAIGRIAATAPIRVAGYSVEGEEDVPDGAVELVQWQLDRLWPPFIKDVLWCLDFGFQSFEKVWEVRSVHGIQRLVMKKLKPLRPDDVRPVVDKDTGAFRGLKQQDVTLPPDKCLWFTNDGEPGDWFGTSRHENVREHAWHPWMQTLKRFSQYIVKISGVLPILEYPLGSSRDKNGDEKSNFELATSILSNLATGKGVAMPNVFTPDSVDLARAGVDLTKLQAWRIKFLETKGNHGQSFIDMMRHFETLMLRGWIVPERSITEGQHGTKAEAGEHANIGLVMADLLFDDILHAANEYVVVPLLTYNYGEDVSRMVKIQKVGLDAATRKLFTDILAKVMTSDANISLLMEMLNVEAMIDAVGLPSNPDIDRDALKEKLGVEGEEETDAQSLLNSAYRGLNARNQNKPDATS